MKRVTLFVLMLGASLLLLNVLTGCQHIPTKKGAAENQSAAANSSQEAELCHSLRPLN